MLTSLKKRNKPDHSWLSPRAISFFTFLFCSVLFPSLYAQVTPKEGSTLNYRIIGFSFPPKQNATQYLVEIARGKITKEKDFISEVHQTVSSDNNKIIAEVPSFGSEYTWRIVYKSGSRVLAKSSLHFFTTGNIPDNMASKKTLRVTANAQQYASNYILIDGSNVMYDMNGKPVWYLPDADSLQLENDIKVSPAGTITFLTKGDAYEIAYTGERIWHAKKTGVPHDRATNDYSCHHEFTKLSNGRYMALTAQGRGGGHRQAGEENRKRFFPALNNSELTEFDKDGKAVWSWESSQYIRQSDLWALHELYPKVPVDLHENAFYFDEENSVIYLSMAAISRIVKIQYPSGKVLAAYGTKFIASPSLVPDSNMRSPFVFQQLLHNKLFSHQHALKRSDDGYLCLYNNNVSLVDTTAYPQVLKMKESGDTLQIAWNFDCRAVINDSKLQPGAGGNVVVLPNNSVFVSMSSPYCDMFIVDTNKNISWSAVAEAYVPTDKAWIRYTTYRANIVTMAQLEKLIWGKN